MEDFEKREKPKGGYTIAHVPHTASQTQADCQFNRFYMAAICRQAINNNKIVTVYRAKLRSNPRPESINIEGTTINAETLLAEMRSKSLSLKCDLLKPNSGLSVHLLT